MFFKLFPLVRLMWMADETGAGGQTPTEAGEKAPSAEESGPPEEKNTSTGEGEGPGTFTQEDLNRVASKTRNEARTKLLKDLGVESLEALQEVIQAKKAADEQAKSDLQKAQEAAEQAKQRAEAAEAALQAERLRSAFDRAAVEQVADLELAYLAARETGLLGEELVQITETGAVTGMDKAVKKLLEQKPILKKQAAQPGGTGGSEGGSGKPALGSSEARLRARFGL